MDTQPTRLRRPTRNFTLNYGQPNPLKRILESQHLLKNNNPKFDAILLEGINTVIGKYKNNKAQRVFINQDLKYTTTVTEPIEVVKGLTFLVRLLFTVNPLYIDGDIDIINIPDDKVAGFQNKDVLPEYQPIFEERP